MVKHLVFLRFKDEADGSPRAALIEEARTRIVALKGQIPQIIEIEVGTDFNGSDAAWDAAIYSTFASSADLEIYNHHPVHIPVKHYVGSVTTARAVVDYEA